MTEKYPMTKDGLQKLKSELENLKNIEFKYDYEK